jgi:hypothetical protein
VHLPGGARVQALPHRRGGGGRQQSHRVKSFNILIMKTNRLWLFKWPKVQWPSTIIVFTSHSRNSRLINNKAYANSSTS